MTTYVVSSAYIFMQLVRFQKRLIPTEFNQKPKNKYSQTKNLNPQNPKPVVYREEGKKKILIKRGLIFYNGGESFLISQGDVFLHFYIPSNWSVLEGEQVIPYIKTYVACTMILFPSKQIFRLHSITKNNGVAKRSLDLGYSGEQLYPNKYGHRWMKDTFQQTPY